jgi:protein-disulfide isomerase
LKNYIIQKGSLMRHFKRPLFYALAFTGLLTFGCQKDSNANAGTTPSKGEAAEQNVASQKDTSIPESCQAYSQKVCDELGQGTPSCSAVQLSAKIISESACKAALKDMDYTRQQITALKAECTKLTTKLCADLGETTQTCAMVKERVTSFPPERCMQMMTDYDKVLAQLQRMEEANKPLNDESRASIEKGDAPAFGPKDAKVTVVEFSDFECPYCSRAAEVVDQIKAKYSKQVRFVFRQFPLSFHKNADLAAQASLAANEQGKFWSFHDVLFKNQRSLDRKSLEDFAKKAGLDMAKFKKALDSKTFQNQVQADLKLGSAVAVSGTPTMFINGQRVQNPTDFDSVSTMIDSALAAK